MKLKALMAVVAVVGCYGVGPVGPPGPKGDPGLQGPQATVPAIVWRNTTGTVIAIGEMPRHKDGNGNLWFVDTDSGNVDLNAQPTSRVVFASTNCTGPSFYQGPLVTNMFAPRLPFFPPRIPFFVDSESQWRVRTSGIRAQMLNIQSALQADGSCSTSNFPNQVVLATGPASSSTTVLPDLGMTGPLQPETYQD